MSLLKHKSHREEEKEVASIMAGLNENMKRDRSDSSLTMDDFELNQPSKKMAVFDNSRNDNGNNESSEWVLKPAPYFYYTDRSREVDDDPLTPLTPLGRVPNFPAKMHAILSDPALANIVAWSSHGRSWQILHPRKFESYVLPKYFDHAKFSSFVRQANGWGFRRMTQGHDRNAYYHEYFLQGLPHLCKKMRRPKVSEKKSVKPEHEPDLFAISREFPIPGTEFAKRNFTPAAAPPPMSPVPPQFVMTNKVPHEPTPPQAINVVTPTHSIAPDLAHCPPQLLQAMSASPQFAAGFLAASTAHAATVRQVAAYIRGEYARQNSESSLSLGHMSI